MRIAIYHNLLSGGAKRALAELTKRLADRHEVDVYTLSCSNHDFADLRPFARDHYIFPFAPLSLFESPFGRLNQVARTADLMRLGQVNREIAREIERQDYDVVFVHPCQFETSPSLLVYLKEVPTVYYCPEPLRRVYEPTPARPYDRAESRHRQLLDRVDPLIRLYYGMLIRRDRQHLRGADRIVVNSKFTRSTIERIYQVQAHVSYLGVDSSTFRPLPREKGKFVLSVGSLTPLKGFDFLIAALAHITDAKRPPLVIVSNFQNPPERDYLQQLAKEAGVTLQLLNGVDDDDLVQLYNEAALVAYAPVREPFGLVALEAMACGTPVVGVSEGGLTETVVNGVTGLLVERDVTQFAAAVDYLLSRPELAQSYGDNGRQRVLSYWTWERATAIAEQHLSSGCASFSRRKERYVFANG